MSIRMSSGAFLERETFSTPSFPFAAPRASASLLDASRSSTSFLNASKVSFESSALKPSSVIPSRASLSSKLASMPQMCIDEDKLISSSIQVLSPPKQPGKRSETVALKARSQSERAPAPKFGAGTNQQRKPLKRVKPFVPIFVTKLNLPLRSFPIRVLTLS